MCHSHTIFCDTPNNNGPVTGVDRTHVTTIYPSRMFTQ